MDRFPTWSLIVAALALVSPVTTRAMVSTTTDLPEVEVVGKRLYQLQKAIIQTEDKFLARYNELNQDRDFDVHCRQEAPAGTRIQKRICRVHFYELAEEEWARYQLDPSNYYAPPPDLVALQRADEYQRKALAVINSDTELRRLLRAREALEKKYYAARKEAFKGRWIAF